jgi:hypothetical protein
MIKNEHSDDNNKHKIKIPNLKTKEAKKLPIKNEMHFTPTEGTSRGTSPKGSKRAEAGNKSQRVSSFENQNKEFYLYYNDEKYNKMLK